MSTRNGTSSKNGNGTGDWSSFGSEWEPFREAWTERGFRLPPNSKQRELLWKIADSRPEDLGRWVREAPESKRSPYEVAGFAVDRWKTLV